MFCEACAYARQIAARTTYQCVPLLEANTQSGGVGETHSNKITSTPHTLLSKRNAMA